MKRTDPRAAARLRLAAIEAEPGIKAQMRERWTGSREDFERDWPGIYRDLIAQQMERARR